MYKITYYIGCNDKDTLKQELPDTQIISVIDSVFDNYTLSQALGRFTNKDGVKTFEKGFVVTLITDDEYERNIFNVAEKVELLKNNLNQESILVTREVI